MGWGSEQVALQKTDIRSVRQSSIPSHSKFCSSIEGTGYVEVAVELTLHFNGLTLAANPKFMAHASCMRNAPSPMSTIRPRRGAFLSNQPMMPLRADQDAPSDQ